MIDKWYHYKLNFKKETYRQRQNNNDIGFIIAGTLGNQYLCGAIFITNAQFMDARTAKEYLSLTYTPRFRYIAELPDGIQPVHIMDDTIGERYISQRTCPAFKQHGGAGEWIIPTEKILNCPIPLQTDHYYIEGGNADRWYMAAWDHQLLINVLPQVLSSFTGRIITDKTLKSAHEKMIKINDLRSISDISSFWDDNTISIMIIKPDGLVLYSPLQFHKTRDYKLLAYLSISCGYYVLQDVVYIKLWGALWEDYINFNSLSAQDASNCDNLKDDLKAKLIGETPNCYYHATMEQYANTIMNYEACGIRLCAYFLETGDMVFPLDKKGNVISNKLTSTLLELVKQFKEILLTTYKKPNLSWCNVPKAVVLLPKLGINVKV